jgi:hypothetical protein
MSRIGMCCLFLLASFCTQVLAADKPLPANQLSADDIQAGWIKLFDGESLFGWKANSNVDWKVKDGLIEAATGDSGLLVSTTEFSDYELKCDFWMAKGGNSGIFLQTPFAPKDPKIDCYELNICDSRPKFGTGSLVGLVEPTKRVTGEETWKTFHVTVRGAYLQVKLDGEVILDYTNPSPTARKTGFIGLQKNSGHVRFKNVFLKPLASMTLFDGKDLTGWRVVPGSKSEFAVKEGTIQVTNGAGFLETTETWADFVLQSEIRTNGKHLNSGIFFRALPGTEKNPSDGYECQVRNEWEKDDRNKPVDFGTGAIYRRIASRRVVSNDEEWFTMTLVARGPHVSVWVNGFQTTDWTDTRKPDPNPRKGLRTEAGHLSLQGHDPTTNLNFRNFRLTEYPKTP